LKHKNKLITNKTLTLMKKTTLFTFTLLFSGLLFAQTPVFDSSMTVTPYLTVNSPSSESIDQAIDDNVNTKFLDFDEEDGAGFIVNLGSVAKLAQSIEVTTANDAELRDPTIVEIAGSNNGTDYTDIASVTIPCITDRFTARTFDFTNVNTYTYYRINFVQECNDVEGIIQIAEVQLYEETLSVEEFTLEQNLTLVPNPSHGVFKINTKKNSTIKNVIIYDVLGKVALTVIDATVEINTSTLSKGLYLVNIETTEGRVTKKLIVD
jgi:hypothetical protein